MPSLPERIRRIDIRSMPAIPRFLENIKRDIRYDPKLPTDAQGVVSFFFLRRVTRAFVAYYGSPLSSKTLTVRDVRFLKLESSITLTLLNATFIQNMKRDFQASAIMKAVARVSLDVPLEEFWLILFYGHNKDFR